jgi:hypothetical protein
VRYHGVVLVWIFWILAIIVAAVALVWLSQIAMLMISVIPSHGSCPYCGLPLEVTDTDRVLEELIDPRYRRIAGDHCSHCGWQR